MKVILFSSDHDPVRIAKFNDVINRIVPKENCLFFQDAQTLADWLCSPKKISLPLIAILIAKNENVLGDLIQMEDMLDGFKIILVLSDRHARSIAMGHKLRPRYMTYVDSGLLQVETVLHKMLMCDRQPGG